MTILKYQRNGPLWPCLILGCRVPVNRRTRRKIFTVKIVDMKLNLCPEVLKIAFIVGLLV